LTWKKSHYKRGKIIYSHITLVTQQQLAEF
jgi:hypothetical protein